MTDHTSKPQATLEALMNRCEGAYSPRTLRGYAGDLRFFEDWCDAHFKEWLPAKPETVAAFVDDQIAHYRIATIKRRVVAIAFAHRMLELPSPTEHSSVRLALRRAKRTKSQRPEQVRGLTHEILTRLLEAQPRTLPALRNTALVSVGYDTLGRSSDLAAMRVEHLRREDGRIVSVLIPRSKSDLAGDGRIGHLSPATAERLEEWLTASGISAGPLFQGLHLRRPSGVPLNTGSIRRLVKRTLEEAGLPPVLAEQYSGHSMRIGAAQDMMVAGFDILAIMQAGGWTTPHVAIRYVEKTATRKLHERRWATLATMLG